MTEVYPILNSDTKCVYNANENNDMPSLEWETACDARLLKGLQLPWSKYPDTSPHTRVNGWYNIIKIIRLAYLFLSLVIFTFDI